MPDDLYEQVILFQNGKISAFTKIYADSYHVVFKCALSMVKNENDANDLVQIVYLRVYTKLNTLDDAKKFKSWLLSITYNEAKNFLKSQSRTLTRIDPSFDISEREEAIDVSDEEADIEEQNELQESNAILKELIAQLPEEQQKIIELYYFEEKDISEISSILSIPTGTVKSRLNYARKKLKKYIESYEKKNKVQLHSGVIGLILVQHLAAAQKAAVLCKTVATVAAVVTVSTVSTTTITNQSPAKLFHHTSASVSATTTTTTSYDLDQVVIESAPENATAKNNFDFTAADDGASVPSTEPLTTTGTEQAILNRSASTTVPTTTVAEEKRTTEDPTYTTVTVTMTRPAVTTTKKDSDHSYDRDDEEDEDDFDFEYESHDYYRNYYEDDYADDYEDDYDENYKHHNYNSSYEEYEDYADYEGHENYEEEEAWFVDRH